MNDFVPGSLDQSEPTSDFIASMLQASSEFSVIGIDLAGKIVFWNEGATHLYRYTAQEVMGQGSTGLLFSNADIEAGKVRELLAFALREGKWEGAVTQLRQHGNAFSSRLVVTRRYDAFGKPIGFLQISKDVTDETSEEHQLLVAERRTSAIAAHQSARHLRDSEERFRMLIENVEDYAILMLDTEGRIASWNIGAERINGYRADEILGQHISKFYLNEDIITGRPEIELTAALADGKLEVEGWRVRADGSLLWASMAITVLRDQSGSLRGFALIMHDMTERKRVESEMRKLNAELEQRVQERVKDLEAFSYSVSHDLRAPLRAIVGFSQILGNHHRASLNEEGQRYMDNIIQSSAHMSRMIDDLLSYSKIGRSAVDLEPVNISAVVADVRRNLSVRLAEADATLSCSESLPIVMGTWILLSQVVTNLLDNALTYRREHERLAIAIDLDSTSVENNVNFIVLCISDNGIGIESRHFGRIFDVFQRLHTQEEYPGTGIGLAIVSRAVGLMGGDIWLASEVGKGTSFYIKLRAAALMPGGAA